MSERPRGGEDFKFSSHNEAPAPDNKREKNAQECAEVSPELIERAFFSPNFQERLLHAAEAMRKNETYIPHGLKGGRVGRVRRAIYSIDQPEVGFAVSRNPISNELVYGKVVEGDFEIGASSVALQKSLPVAVRRSRKMHHFSSLHFHPANAKTIIPSGPSGDLENSHNIREWLGQIGGREENKVYDLPPIEMVAMLNSDGSIRILVYRENSRNISHETIKMFDDEVDYENSQDEVVRALETYGYRAAMVEASGDGSLSNDSRAVLHRFAYAPIEIPFEQSNLGRTL